MGEHSSLVALGAGGPLTGRRAPSKPLPEIWFDCSGTQNERLMGALPVGLRVRSQALRVALFEKVQARGLLKASRWQATNS